MIEWLRGADWPQVALVLGSLGLVVVALIFVPSDTTARILEALGVAGLLTGAARRRGLTRGGES